MKKLSVALATFNEEENLARCLESVAWADEIVICDEGSTDQTLAIAKKYTNKILINKHTDFPTFHQSKQKAIDHCAGEWILEIDADEEVTGELKEEINKAVFNPGENVGFQVPRRSEIFGYLMKHTGWYPDYQVKLFKKGHGRYQCETVHEQIYVDGQVGTLPADLWHHHYTSVDQFITRLNRYTTNDAEYLHGKGENVRWSDAFIFPADEFFRRFFLWEGYKDGLHGLVLSLFQAFNRFVVFAKIWEKQGFGQYNNDRFLDELHRETKKIVYDWRFWNAAVTKNPIKKIIWKSKNKFGIK